MNIFKNILAVILGWLFGSMVNMGLIKMGHSVYPIKGVDPSDMEALAQVMPTLGSEYFIFPFLAHAFGTLVGAAVVGFLAVNHKMKFSIGIGALFLIGGTMMSFMLPGPKWFAAVDIGIAYIPMAWIGGNIALKLTKNN